MGGRGLEERLKNSLGAILRKTRQERGMTLNRVATRSKGRFKPSSIGGYERGERAVSLERFCVLSDVYCIPADQLLSSVLDGMYPVRQQRISLELSRLSSVGIDRVRLVAEFVHRIRAQRGDYLTDVISLRSGDLQALALESAVEHAELLTTLEPAVRTDGDLKQALSYRKGVQ